MQSAARQASKRDLWMIAVIAWAIAYALIVLVLTPAGIALPPDTIDYAEAARSLVRGQGDTIDRVMFHTGYWRTIRHPLEVHGLLQPWLITPLFALFGPSGALVRVPSVLSAAGLGLLVFWAGRRLFGLVAGVIAALLIFTRVDLVFGGLLGADDIGYALFAFGAIVAFLIGIDSGRQRAFWVAGCCTALAALEKFSGMVVPGVFIGVLLLSARARRALRLGGLVRLLVPLAPVLLLYVFRNYRVYGSLGSPYGGVEWLGKDSFSAYFALYEKPPTVPEALAQLGRERVLALIFGELREFAAAVADDWLLLALGPALLVLLFLRRERLFAAAALLYCAGITVVVCVLHHVEPRYLSALGPLAAVAVGALAAAAARWVEARVPATRVSLARRLATAGAVVVLFAGMIRPLTLAFLLGANGKSPHQCQAAAEFLQHNVESGVSVVSSDPWFVSWYADRAAINAPTNGDSALLRVVERYRSRWAVTGARAFGALDLEAALQREPIKAALRPELVFDKTPCRVYRLRPDG